MRNERGNLGRGIRLPLFFDGGKNIAEIGNLKKISRITLG